MSDVGPSPARDSLPASELCQLDQICTGFEDAWKAGPQPRIEDYLARVRPEVRLLLLRELIALDYHYHARANQTFPLEHYRARFPEFKSEWLAAEILGKLGSSDIPGGPATTVADASADREQSSDGTVIGQSLRQLGEYRIVREIGRGGMGVVYEAVQESLGRHVALKILPMNILAAPNLLERFRREAKAAARLHHTNIVSVYGVGECQGVHYYAMQFIRGRGLHDVLKEVKRLREPKDPLARDSVLEESTVLARGLVTGQLLPVAAHSVAWSANSRETAGGEAALPAPAVSATEPSSELREASGAEYCRSVVRMALQVAEALDYAHRQGVVHRDIKPSNLLLDGQGTVWVTDFGLAKAEGTDDLTRTGDILGTLQYMAPERFEGVSGGSSDIYALGITMYEMLTLARPFEAEDRLRLLEQIRTQEPMRPRLVDRRIPLDLETIVLKAMAKEPARRYITAAGMAADLGRYLAGEPILARRIGVLERSVKWARRRPATAALVTVSAVALVILTTGSLVANAMLNAALHKAEISATAAKEARDAAELREFETNTVLDFVDGRVFAAARPKGMQGGLGRDATLREALDAALPYVKRSFVAQPLIEARLRRTLGLSFLKLGEGKIAAEQFAAARSIYLQHLGPDHADTVASIVGLASSYAQLGRQQEALELREQSVSLCTQKLGPEDAETLRCRNNLALSYQALGRREEALELRKETLKLQKAVLGPDHPDTLISINNLGNSYRDQGRHAEALSLHEEALAIQERKLGADHPETLMTMHNLANDFEDVQRKADALRLREKTLAIQKSALGPDHPETLLSMGNLAVSYSALGRDLDATRLCEEAVMLRKGKLGSDHPDTLWSMMNLAGSYGILGRHAEALKLHEETLALKKARLGADHPDSLLSMWGVATSLLKLDRGPEAIRIIDECIERAAGKVVYPGLLPGVIDLRLRYFEESKDPAGCSRTAELWENLKRTDPGSLYDAACMRAVTAGVLLASGKSAAAKAQADQEANRAMAWLKQAVAAGYKDVSHIKQDKDLQALRSRADFKQLLSDVELKQP